MAREMSKVMEPEDPSCIDAGYARLQPLIAEWQAVAQRRPTRFGDWHLAAYAPHREVIDSGRNVAIAV